MLLFFHPDLVSSIDYNGDTPLHWTAIKGHKDVAELLLASKVDVNAKANDGMTPLFFTASKDVAELLHQHGGHE